MHGFSGEKVHIVHKLETVQQKSDLPLYKGTQFL